MMLRIKDTEAIDIRRMYPFFTDLDIKSVYIDGLSPNKALWRTWKLSYYSKAIYNDDNIIAIFGTIGSPLSQIGYPWSIISKDINISKYKIFSIYKYFINTMMERHDILIDYVFSENKRTIRTLKLIGFKEDTIDKEYGSWVKMVKEV